MMVAVREKVETWSLSAFLMKEELRGDNTHLLPGSTSGSMISSSGESSSGTLQQGNRYSQTANPFIVRCWLDEKAKWYDRRYRLVS